MYKFLTKEIKEFAETKNKNDKKAKNKVESISTDVIYVDVGSKIAYPIKSSDVRLCVASNKKGESSLPTRKDFIGFMNNEMNKGRELTALIKKNNVSRTKLHKMLGISRETLRKLEEEPIALDDKFKHHIRKKIHKVIDKCKND